MLVSTTISALCKLTDIKDAIRITAEAGFDAFDMPFFGKTMELFSGDDYVEKAKDLRKYADGLGIVCNQAHAPCPSSRPDLETTKQIYKDIVRSMEVASVLGAKIIAVHPVQHLKYAEHPDELFEMNVKFYKSLIPYCEKFGIRVGCENMWQDNSRTQAITESTCARAWEFCKYLDAVNSEWIVGCLDIGHVSLVNADIPEFIHKMGNKRLRALHIHDTDYVKDLHTMPFLGKIDYHAVCKALGEIGYEGDVTFEADGYENYGYANQFPLELMPAAEKLLCSVGKYLASEIEKNRKNEREAI
ncbi:MAG: sugar phosphate isomerase/epimerase [Clostridia bacterium]|nr:sugar phosphate isomerase/epimerase [Clostridia bacterium]